MAPAGFVSRHLGAAQDRAQRREEWLGLAKTSGVLTLVTQALVPGPFPQPLPARNRPANRHPTQINTTISG